MGSFPAPPEAPFVGRFAMGFARILAVSALCPLAIACSTTSSTRSAAPPAEHPWWREAVFYEVFVRSFADSTTGPLAGDGVGDIRGLIERLDYINDGDPATTDDLGATALWLMPIMESPSYHGYDIVDYYAVDREYGTAEDFRELVRECDRRGVRIVIDMVLNHTSHEHPWFAEARDAASPRRDWYIWSPSRPTDCGEDWGHKWHDTPSGWYYGWFGGHMPDLDYRNADVTREMHAMSAFWLGDMGAAGLRLDAIRHLIETDCVDNSTPETHAWLKDYHAFCRSVRPDAMLVGEVWDKTETVVGYGPDELDLTFQFDLAGAILDATKTRSAANLRETQARISAGFRDEQYATFLTNHDIRRVMTELSGDRRRAATAAAILLTGPGVPFVYYGEEIGMSGDKPDHRIRTPMPWNDNGGFSTAEPWSRYSDDPATLNVIAQDADPASMLNLYRALIHARTAHPALRTGAMRLVPCSSDAVYSFVREEDGQRVLVVANLSDAEVAGCTFDAAASGITEKTRLVPIFRSNAASPAPPTESLAPESVSVYLLE